MNPTRAPEFPKVAYETPYVAPKQVGKMVDTEIIIRKAKEQGIIKGYQGSCIESPSKVALTFKGVSYCISREKRLELCKIYLDGGVIQFRLRSSL